MTYKELYAIRQRWYQENHPYKMIYWDDYNFGELDKITWLLSRRGKDRLRVNDCYIMCDTETSKKDNGSIDNHVVAWTISIRAFHLNIVTLWGRRPSDFVDTLHYIMLNMDGDQTVCYFHNLAYDYVFLRKFLFNKFGYPIRELNTKPHYPVCLTWENGLIIKDSLILAQRSLDKWASDYNVEHQKAVGKWDYNKIRTQAEEFSADELEYIEHDTLAGVECLDAMMTALNKTIATAPYTATGIPREGVRKAGKPERAKEVFKRQALDYGEYLMSEHVYHGGYTHANRHEIGWVNPAICYDFASSYPYCLLAHKYPSEKFTRLADKKPEDILKLMDDYAFMFKLILIRPRLKDDMIPMPALQLSKCVKHINSVTDNGRILCAEFTECFICEQDLDIICRQYDYDGAICTQVHAAAKDYLPKYLRDYVFTLFKEKTQLKGGDPVLYALAKAKLNSVYGMTVQKSIRDDLMEDFETGEYFAAAEDPEEKYEKYLKSHNNILCYQWGVWCTAYAMHNLFDLGSCISGDWLYSDTDSCYGTEWDNDKLKAYNDKCKALLTASGYGPVMHNDREYWLGVAELDGVYTEFKTLGAKRYACRNTDGKLKITVAGVPKIGVKCLNDDINNFKKGLIFAGAVTGKLTHTYIYVDDIYTDDKGNETGDSVDLTPCDYLLDDVSVIDWEKLFTEEISVPTYEEDTQDAKFI